MMVALPDFSGASTPRAAAPAASVVTEAEIASFSAELAGHPTDEPQPETLAFPLVQEQGDGLGAEAVIGAPEIMFMVEPARALTARPAEEGFVSSSPGPFSSTADDHATRASAPIKAWPTMAGERPLIDTSNSGASPRLSESRLSVSATPVTDAAAPRAQEVDEPDRIQVNSSEASRPVAQRASSAAKPATAWPEQIRVQTASGTLDLQPVPALPPRSFVAPTYQILEQRVDALAEPETDYATIPLRETTELSSSPTAARVVDATATDGAEERTGAKAIEQGAPFVSSEERPRANADTAGDGLFGQDDPQAFTEATADSVPNDLVAEEALPNETTSELPHATTAPSESPSEASDLIDQAVPLRVLEAASTKPEAAMRRLAALRWIDTLGPLLSQQASRETNRARLDLDLGEADGHLSVRARQEEGRLVVAIQLTDPAIRATAQAQADQILARLEEHYGTTVDLTFSQGDGHDADRGPHQPISNLLIHVRPGHTAPHVDGASIAPSGWVG